MITAVFTDGNDCANTCGLWQWDYGQELRIQGLNLPKAVEIHFALKETGSEALIRVGVTSDGVTTVTIPDSMLEGAESTYDYKIFAWIYLADPNTGETIKKIVIPVKSRSKPEAFDSPEDREIFEEAIKAVNGAVNRAEELANDAIEVGEEAKEAAAKAEECLEEAQKLAGQIVENVKDEAVKAVEAKGTEQAGIVAAEGAKQIDEIKRVIATIPEDYTQLDQHVQDLDNGLNTKAPAIRLEATVQNGGPTELLMPGESGLQALTVYGKSKQLTTKGEQLLNHKELASADALLSYSTDGRTITIEGSKARCCAEYELPTHVVKQILGKKVYIGGTIAGGNSANIHLGVFDGETPEFIGGSSVLIPENASKIVVRLMCNDTADNLQEPVTATFTDVMVSLSPITEWEPYTGGIPAPNPNYPQEIESVGEEVGIRCGGKNWTIKDKFKESNVNKIAFLEAGKYTISVQVEQLSNRNTWGFNLMLGEKAINTGAKRSLVTSNDQPFGIDFHKTFTMKERGWVSFNGYSPERYEVMIVLGNEKAPYEPYREPSTSILQLPNGLPGIPVTSDGNYTDPDGQQWVCDTIEWDRASGTGEYVKRVVQDIVGSVDSKENGTYSLWLLKGVEANHFYQHGWSMAKSNAMCDMAKVTGYAVQTTEEARVSLKTTGNNLGWAYCIYIPNIEQTVDAYNTYLAEHPFTIIAQAGIPIRTPLTADQIKALKSLRTFHPTSIINNDQGADMQVIYAADTKAYIDSKIDALSKTILDAVGGK